jgi:hypothetical protein
LVVNFLVDHGAEVVNSRDATGSSGNLPGGRNMTWENRKKGRPSSDARDGPGCTRPMVWGFPVRIRWQSHNGPD